MKKLKVSVTEAARNFADCVKRTYYQNVTFVLLKNGSPVARLTPEPQEKVCSGRDLSKAIAEVELPKKEVKAWHRDLLAGGKALQAPANKWR